MRCTTGWACVALLVLQAACATEGAKSPQSELERVWRDFLELPTERAMAIAGDPRSNRWVTASSAGHRNLDVAIEAALSECRKRRQLRRLQEHCVVYAAGDEIVWRGR